MKRAPKWMGFGVCVSYQFTTKQLVKGDTFNDADLGLVVWNGKKWVPSTAKSTPLKYKP